MEIKHRDKKEIDNEIAFFDIYFEKSGFFEMVRQPNVIEMITDGIKQLEERNEKYTSLGAGDVFVTLGIFRIGDNDVLEIAVNSIIRGRFRAVYIWDDIIGPGDQGIPQGAVDSTNTP